LQVLARPESLDDPNTYILLISERKASIRAYVDTNEVRFTGRTFQDLQAFLSKMGGTRFVKHVPHEFVWKQLDPEMECSEKKKGKERKFLLKEITDLKHYPLCLKDGDHLGLITSDVLDDYQTEWDSEMRE
jgi:hypothetical protein